jgi:ASPM-SPD-2-Hydin domain-containing protein
VPLSGTGLGPTATLSKASLAFAGQVVGTTSAATVVTVANNGNQALNITGMAVAPAGEFAVATSGTTCSTAAPVAGGASCAINITFTPTASGARSATLTITDNAQGSPQAVALSGTGQDFTVLPSQPSATVNAGGTATFTLSVASQGGFNQAVNLSCSLPAAMTLSTCAVSPNTVTPSGASPATPTVTITTTAGSLLGPTGGRQRGLPRQTWWRDLAVPLFGLIALATLAALCRRRHSRGGGNPWVPAFAGTTCKVRGRSSRRGTPWRARTGFALTLTLLMLLAWAACGGGAGVTHMPGTPAGTYTITITAADPQANLTQTTSVQLTVNP